MKSRLPETVLVMLIALVGSFEGLRQYAYRDPVGIPTICFGHTEGVQMGQWKSRAECEGLLANELERAYSQIMRCIVVPLNANQAAALTSLVYNAGPAAVCGSTLQRRFNAGDYTGGCNRFADWKYARGQVLPGLVRRRELERQLCLRAAP